MGALPGPFLSRCGKGVPARQLAMWRYPGIFLLDASPDVLESSFPKSPESNLGVCYTPSLDELVFLEVGLSGPANGGYADACQDRMFQEVDLVNQGSHLRSFEWSRLFNPGSLELEESAYEGGEARFMVPTVEPCSVPSPERIFERKIKKTSTRVSL
jgi:hypothetical protein